MNEAGKMRHKVTIQRRQLVRDEGGGFAQGWADDVTIWAQVKPATATAVIIANQPQQQVTHDVKIRYRSDLTKKDRLTYRGRILEIEDIVNEDELGKFLRITCIESGV
jgi:SPP1 family predicted phage head-tail adaptor